MEVNGYKLVAKEFECSNCGYLDKSEGGDNSDWVEYDLPVKCPKCGADMIPPEMRLDKGEG